MISVVVPIYNVCDYLDRCLTSLREQSFTDFEVLMVDDGSTDQSAKVARSFAQKDKRFIYIYQDNAGQGSARNHGIRLAKGEYFCFVDSDDYVHSHFLQFLYNRLIQTHSDISVCGVQRVFDGGRTANYKITNRDGGNIITDIDEYLLSASFSVCNKMFKRFLFEGLEFPENMKYEDFALMPRVYEKANSIASIEDKLYYYYYRSNSTTVGTKINLDILKAQVILEKSTFAKRHPKIIRVYFVRQVLGTLLWAMSQELKYKSQVMQIVNEGFSKYPDLNKYIKEVYIGSGKSFWGRLLLNKHYMLACFYACTYEKVRFWGRKVKNIVKY